MNSFPFFLSLLFLCVGLELSSAHHQPAAPQPIPIPRSEIQTRRDAFDAELDDNQEAVKELYELLDATPEADRQPREFLQSQILQYDDRNAVLFDALDAMDREEYEQGRKLDLKVRIERLRQEAVQFRKAGRVLDATTREARARSLEKSFQDGTWKLLIAGEWSCEVDGQKSDLTELRLEVEKLRSEMLLLRREVKQLRGLLGMLTQRQIIRETSSRK